MMGFPSSHLSLQTPCLGDDLLSMARDPRECLLGCLAKYVIVMNFKGTVSNMKAWLADLKKKLKIKLLYLCYKSFHPLNASKVFLTVKASHLVLGFRCIEGMDRFIAETRNLDFWLGLTYQKDAQPTIIY